MTYLVFHDIVRLPHSVPAENAVEMTREIVLNEILPLLKEDGEFFGLIDSNRTTLQVLYTSNDDQEYWVEIPSPSLGGSFGAHFDWNQVNDLFGSLAETFPQDGFAEFDFHPWS